MNFQIIDAEIIDNTRDEDGCVQPSEISVVINVEIEGTKYYLDYQTTSTFDYGAFSSELAAYADTDYYKISEMFEDGVLSDEFQGLLDSVKEESGAQRLWREYVEENYAVEEGNFGGIDARSEINKATRR